MSYLYWTNQNSLFNTINIKITNPIQLLAYGIRYTNYITDSNEKWAYYTLGT